MERLTQKAPDSEMVWFKDKERLFEPCEMSAHQSRLAIAKLAAYEQAEEQGLLLRLPCKLGDIAYEITGATTRGYVWKYLTYEKAYIHGTVFNLSRMNDIGKTLFLTKEEAEEKLKELKEMGGAE